MNHRIEQASLPDNCRSNVTPTRGGALGQPRQVRSAARHATCIAFAMALACCPPPAAASENFPSRPIHIVVGVPVGTGMDVTLRTLQGPLQAELGQPVVIEQRVGADQLLAARQVASATADGHTLLAGTRTQFAVNPVVYANPGYEPDRDFAPITLLGHNIMVLVVQPSLPVNTLAELAAYSRSLPGTLNYGAGSPSVMLATEALKAAAGADLTQIPYNGFASSLRAVAAGDVHLCIVDVPTALPAIRAGRVRALAVSGERRFPSLPDVPTIAEAGYARTDPTVWNALYAPAGTPEAVIARLRRAFTKALEAPETAKRIVDAGIVPVTSTPAVLREKAQDDRAEAAALAKRLGLVPR